LATSITVGKNNPNMSLSVIFSVQIPNHCSLCGQIKCDCWIPQKIVGLLKFTEHVLLDRVNPNMEYPPRLQSNHLEFAPSTEYCSLLVSIIHFCLCN